MLDFWGGIQWKASNLQAGLTTAMNPEKMRLKLAGGDEGEPEITRQSAWMLIFPQFPSRCESSHGPL